MADEDELYCNCLEGQSSNSVLLTDALRNCCHLLGPKYAWRKGKHTEDCIKELTKVPGAVNIIDEEWRTPLCYSSKKGCLDCIQILLGAGADVNKTSHIGYTPLYEAAGYGREKCVKFLLEAGANVNAVDIIGYTSLTCATQKGFHNCVELLINAGADPNLGLDTTKTPLVNPLARLDSLECLVKTENDVQVSAIRRTPLMKTASGNCVKSVQLLLKAGALINLIDVQHKTALLHAVEFNKLNALLLFAAGEKSLTSSNVAGWEPVPEFLKQILSQNNLKHICREVIRKQLICLKPSLHLFGRIPLLGLPSSLTSYLLYDMSLDEDYDSPSNPSLKK